MFNRLSHPSERNLGFDFTEPARTRIEALTRCYCFSSSSSRSEQSTSSVTGRSAVGSNAATAGDLSTVQTGGVRNEGSGVSAQNLNTGQSLNLTGAQTGNVTVTTGIQQDALQNLIGTLTRASDNEVAQLAESGNQTATLLGSLLAQKTDTGAGNPKTLAIIAAVGLLAFLGLAWLLRKK